jgi:hypothetical protein
MPPYTISDSGTGSSHDEKRFGLEVTQNTTPMQLLQFVASILSNLGWQTSPITHHPDSPSQLVLPAAIPYDTNRFGVASGALSTNALAWSEAVSTYMVIFFEEQSSPMMPWLSAHSEAGVIRALGEIGMQLYTRGLIPNPMCWQPIMGRWTQNQSIRLNSGHFVEVQRS